MSTTCSQNLDTIGSYDMRATFLTLRPFTYNHVCKAQPFYSQLPEKLQRDWQVGCCIQLFTCCTIFKDKVTQLFSIDLACKSMLDVRMVPT